MNYILTNGFVLKADYKTWEAKSLLTRDNKIELIGSLSECKLAARQTPEIIDLKGKLLLPAFTDTHTHFVEFAKSSILVNLSNCSSLDEMQVYLQNYRKNLFYPAKWILGGNWDRNKLSNPQQLNRHFLDNIFPDLPVALMGKDYHSKLCNSMAFNIAGIDSLTPDPAGGHIERDAKGIPTGMLFETATELLDRHVVLPDDAHIISAIRQSVQDIYPLGLIGFHSMESSHSRNLLLSAQQQGQAFRLCWHFMTEDFELAVKERIISYQGDENYKPGGLKIFGDGSLGSQTAAMFEPYPEGGKGILRQSDSELFSLMQQAARHKIASTVHAIGNRCVRQVIDSTIRLSKDYQGLFHRIEHVQSIRNEDIHLLKQSGLFAALQPVHLANDVPMIEKHWKGIQDQVYSFGSLLSAGIPFGFGSDSPIETTNPFFGIYSAIQRRPQLNPQLPAFRPEEAISALQAIKAYSLSAAQASQSQQLRGSIEPGKLADLIVLDDFRTLPDEFWLTAKSHLTMLDGAIVHGA